MALTILDGRVAVSVQSESPACACAPAVLGRAWQAESAQFTAFANDAKTAENLRDWVKNELGAFCQDHDCSALGKGIVFAIESDKEPAEFVQEWAANLSNRSRKLNWSSPIRNQTFQTQAGRPYVLSDLPYFRESFCFPPAAIESFLRLNTPWPKADWICFLALDEYCSWSFDKELERLRGLYEVELKKVPLEVREASRGALAIMEMVAPFVYAKQKLIDLALLQLQRREVLQATWLSKAYSKSSDFQKRLEEHQNEIDRQWQFIWFRRPLD